MACFWIGDQQQSRHLPAPDTRKIARQSVSKFIDHRHRKTLANGAGQRLAAVAAQRSGRLSASSQTPALQRAFAGDRIADLDHRSRQRNR